MSEVRSSELKTRLSSSSDLIEGDTVVSAPQEVRLFMPSRRCMGWMLIHWVDLKIDFNSRSELGFVCPMRRIGPVTSSPGRYAFTSLPSLVC